MINPKFFFAASEIVVTGRDYEAADFDNPEGNLYGLAAYVVAEDDDGRRVRLYVKTSSARVETPIVRGNGSRWENEAVLAAENLAAKLNNRLTVHAKLPVGFSGWEYMQPRYGSDAYIIDHCEDEQKAREQWAHQDLHNGQ